MQPDGLHPVIESWIGARGWTPFSFQRETWQAIAQGRSGLIHATTGSGKTYAVWLGILNGALHLKKAAEPRPEPISGLSPPRKSKQKPIAQPLQVLWITPMRALASDTVRALRAPLEEIALDWSVGARTGDTAPAERAHHGDFSEPEIAAVRPK